MIKLFFQIKTFFSSNNVYFIKNKYFFKKNFFFSNLVLQQMNNHSHRRCYVEKGELKTSSNFTGEHLCRSFFLIKLFVLGLQIYYRERLQHPTQLFYCEICEIVKNTYFEEHLWTTASILPSIINLVLFQDCWLKSISFLSFWWYLIEKCFESAD